MGLTIPRATFVRKSGFRTILKNKKILEGMRQESIIQKKKTSKVEKGRGIAFV